MTFGLIQPTFVDSQQYHFVISIQNEILVSAQKKHFCQHGRLLRCPFNYPQISIKIMFVEKYHFCSFNMCIMGGIGIIIGSVHCKCWSKKI